MLSRQAGTIYKAHGGGQSSRVVCWLVVVVVVVVTLCAGVSPLFCLFGLRLRINFKSVCVCRLGANNRRDTLTGHRH